MRARLRHVIRLLALCLALAAAVALTGSAEPPRTPLTPCDVPGIRGRAHCGTVQVPEDPERATGRLIALRVIRLEGAGSDTLPPILFLAGGPGQAATDLAGFIGNRVRSASQADTLFVDQRGTGASNPLACPPPARIADLMGRLFDLARLRQCRDALSRRADLTKYTTSHAAADVRTLLDALAIEKVDLWGVSYGSRLAMEIARRMPSRVRALVLEAAVPVSLAWPTTGARDADAALSKVIADCEADTACASRHPTFRRDVDQAFSRLAKAPALAQVADPQVNAPARVRFGASDLAYATRGLLYGPEAWRLPQMFRQAAAGVYEEFAHAYVTRARGLGRDIAMGVHLGVYCAEDVPFVDWGRAREHAQGTRLGTYLLDEYAAACEVWPRGNIPSDFREPVRTTAPALILSGRRDPVTPPWTGAAVARTMSTVSHITWPFGGHGYEGLPDGNCKPAVIADFLRAPGGRVSSPCLRAAGALPD